MRGLLNQFKSCDCNLKILLNFDCFIDPYDKNALVTLHWVCHGWCHLCNINQVQLDLPLITQSLSCVKLKFTEKQLKRLSS